MTGGESAISRAVHAEAEEARAEIRAAGICCPSCGVNAADLPDGHLLATDLLTAKCADGPETDLSGDLELAKSAVSVMMFDIYRAKMDEEFSRMLPGWDVNGEES